MQIFDYHGNTIRTVERDGEPWFVLKDVCTVLGIANHKMTAQRLDEDEVSLADLTDSLGRMELIRPMYCIHEEDIIAWRQYNQLEFIQCACRFTENCTICDNGGGGSKRQEIKTLLRRLKRDNPNIEKSIFNSIHTVALDTFPGYKTKGELHSFLENYEEK